MSSTVGVQYIIIGRTMNKALTTLNVPFVKQDLQEDDDYYTFTGYASTFGNLDLGNDIVMRGAFAKSLQERMPKMLWQHDISEVIGKFDFAQEDDNGLVMHGILPKDVARAREAGVLLKMGAIDSMSIGYGINEMEYEGDIRKLIELSLYEVSLVTMPMNPKAMVTSVKGAVPYQDFPMADDDRPWDKSAAEKRIRDHFDAEDAPNARYAKNFMWFDESNKDNFGAYKLLITDVIDGTVKAVPRAIFAVAAVLNGARGGVDIPDADKAKVKSSVEKYYKKMDRESPFSPKFYAIEDVKDVIDIREIEKILRETGCFSRKAAECLISTIKKQRSQSEPDDSMIMMNLIAELKQTSDALR